jgi:energy-coupling factor transport system ATP-binding protein
LSLPNDYYPSPDPLIQISKLTYTYEGSDKPALRNINLTLHQGAFTILAGPSGCGKSTFARCLTGFIPHEYPGTFEGKITIQDQDTRSHAIRDLAQSVSLIQQDPDSQLVTLNVTNEIAFGLENFQHPPATMESRIKWALGAANADNLQSRNTHTLSGGEKQKVVIASFIALQSPVLILDEPTARLDSQTATEILTTLRELHNQGITILVIEHRIQPFLTSASRVLLMNEGKITYDGSPSQLSADPAPLNDLGVYLQPSIYSKAIQPKSRPEQERLNVQALTFTYPRIEEQTAPRPTLENLTFSLHQGEIIALMGANGSGKSTLLLQLMGLLTPDSGTVQLDKQNIHNQPVSQLARQIGFIFQNPLHQIFAPSVKEEVLLATKHFGLSESQEVELRAEQLMKKFGLLKYKDQSPYTLSLGEQRRLTIASILLHKPQVLLLDEPFIGQDYRNVHHLMSVIQGEAAQGTTVLLATHDATIAETYCSRLLFLFDGRLLIDAPVKQGLEYLTIFNQTGINVESKPLEVEVEE